SRSASARREPAQAARTCRTRGRGVPLRSRSARAGKRRSISRRRQPSTGRTILAFSIAPAGPADGNETAIAAAHLAVAGGRLAADQRAQGVGRLNPAGEGAAGAVEALLPRLGRVDAGQAHGL